MDLKKLLEEAQWIIENADDVFADSIEPIQDNIFKVLRNALDAFTTKGKLTKDADSIKTLNRLRGAMLKAVGESKLVGKVDTFLSNFDRLDGLNEDTHKIINDLNIKGLDLRGVKKIETDKIVNGLTTNFGISDGMLKDIQREMYTNIMRGESRSKAVDRLEEAIKGESNPIERHIRTISQDSLGQYDGTVQTIIKDEFNLNARRYIGSIIKTSRNQCVRWVVRFEGIIPDQVLSQEIVWALVNGSGYGALMMPTFDNFGSVRGGHNCRHRAIAFRATEAEIKKALAASSIKEVIRAKDHLSQFTLKDQIDRIKSNS